MRWVQFIVRGICLGFLAAALAFILLGSPALAGPRTVVARENDRAIKLDLIDKLKSSPQILILGSSRAKRAEPAYLQKLTGRTGFNAGVTGGTAADAWVMTRYMADCFPRNMRRFVWFVDVALATNGINHDLEADLRSHKYLYSVAAEIVGRRPCGPGDRTTSSRYKPDGSYTGRAATNLPTARVHLLRRQVREELARIRETRGRNFNSNPERLVWLEKALAFMNRQGARPVLVLNPIHPAVLAELRRYGFPARKDAAETLHRLHDRFDFVVVDAEDVRSWGGDPHGFWSVAHIDTANMRRLLPYLVKHSDGALR